MDVSNSIEIANFFFAFGGFVFTGVSLVLALLTVFAGYLTVKAERLQARWAEDLKGIKDQQEKINNTLIVTADLAISSLPQITFTQQIPVSVLDDVGIIDDIFDGQVGDSIWSSIASQPRASRLAYARAVYRIGVFANSKSGLVGSKRDSDTHSSVVSLLDLALVASEKSLRDPVSLRRDILVRKCQAFRQAKDYANARASANELISLYGASDDIGAYYAGSLSLALVELQMAAEVGEKKHQPEIYYKAFRILWPCFQQAFNLPASDEDAQVSGGCVKRYREKSLGVEVASIAYYTAKALWLYRFSSVRLTKISDGAPDQAENISTSMRRSLDVAFLFYESLRRNSQSDLSISAIYNFCVANIVAASMEIPEAFLGFDESKLEFPELSTQNLLVEHAKKCIESSSEMLNEVRRSHRTALSTFIYSETTERLDKLSVFDSDIKWLRSVLMGESSYREKLGAGR